MPLTPEEEQELKDLEELQALEAERIEYLQDQFKKREGFFAPWKQAIGGTDVAGAALNLSRHVQKGMLDAIALPTDLMNIPLGLAGLPQIPFAEQTREAAKRRGFIPDKPADTFLERTAEIGGASFLPFMAFFERGASFVREGLRNVAAPTTRREALKEGFREQAKMIASKPLPAAMVDVGASLGAGFAGNAADAITDNPALIMLAELGGGFTLPLTTVLTRLATRGGMQTIKSTFAPFTEAGAEPRVSRRLQSLSADPQGDAARIDVNSPISPARQTGNQRLIELENTVLAQRPELQGRITEGLDQALSESRALSSSFGGVDRTRELLRNGRDYLVSLVSLRAQIAAQRAQNRIAELGAQNPRDISRIAREELDAALTETRAQEDKLWKAVGDDQPASFANARQQLSRFEGELSPLVPSEIPAWLSSALRVNAVKLGGNNARPIMLKDVQQVRSRVLQEARKARRNGDFNEARILGDFGEALLKDLEAVDAEGVDAATAFSRQLNERFTQGSVASILSPGARRGAGIAAEDTLYRVVSGPNPATNIREFLAASPDSGPQIEAFLKSRFIERATTRGRVTSQAAQTQFDRFGQLGVFDALPNLRGDLEDTVRLLRRSENLGERAATVAGRGGARLSQTDQRSLAGALLGGDEMANLLAQENAAEIATRLRLRMGNNVDAQQGIKSSFMDALLQGASKDGNISGEKLSQLMLDNADVAKNLGFTADDLSRAKLVASRLAQAQQSAGTAGKSMLDDKPAVLLDVLARVVGASVGRRLNTGTIQAPGFVASMFGSGLRRLTVDKAEQLLVDVMFDPKLFKAALTSPTSPRSRISEAQQILESWVAGAGIVAFNDNRELRPGEGDVPPLPEGL